MLLLKLGSELPNLVREFLSVLTIRTKDRMNFYLAEYFHEVECTPSRLNLAPNFNSIWNF